MCDYVNAADLIKPREVYENWISKVQDEMREEGFTFSYNPIGSGSRNMVIRKCNEKTFDLDYQIVMQKIPSGYSWTKDCKKFKDKFRNTFDKYKPKAFTFCEDSTQALTTKNQSQKYGFDIIITTFDDDGNFYILYNKKNTNSANNEDYEWVKRKDMKKYRERLALIKGAKMWNYLRDIYKEKRHEHKDDQQPNKKKSYQLLNEAVVETLEAFGIKNYPR